MNAQQEERDRLAAALRSFYADQKKAGAIRSVNVWAKASELVPSTINPVINGKTNKRLEDETYFKLSVGATKLLGRPVTVDELKGTPAPENHSEPLDETERALITIYRLLPPADREWLWAQIRREAQRAGIDLEGVQSPHA